MKTYHVLLQSEPCQHPQLSVALCIWPRYACVDRTIVFSFGYVVGLPKTKWHTNFHRGTPRGIGQMTAPIRGLFDIPHLVTSLMLFDICITLAFLRTMAVPSFSPPS